MLHRFVVPENSICFSSLFCPAGARQDFPRGNGGCSNDLLSPAATLFIVGIKIAPEIAAPVSPKRVQFCHPIGYILPKIPSFFGNPGPGDGVVLRNGCWFYGGREELPRRGAATAAPPRLRQHIFLRTCPEDRPCPYRKFLRAIQLNEDYRQSRSRTEVLRYSAV